MEVPISPTELINFRHLFFCILFTREVSWYDHLELCLYYAVGLRQLMNDTKAVIKNCSMNKWALQLLYLQVNARNWSRADRKVCSSDLMFSTARHSASLTLYMMSCSRCCTAAPSGGILSTCVAISTITLPGACTQRYTLHALIPSVSYETLSTGKDLNTQHWVGLLVLLGN